MKFGMFRVEFLGKVSFRPFEEDIFAKLKFYILEGYIYALHIRNAR